jgi:hypothetical protein
MFAKRYGIVPKHQIPKHRFLTLLYKVEPEKKQIMKKIALSLVLMAGIIALSSCDYDDSDDIDFITPNDSTATGIIESELPE